MTSFTTPTPDRCLGFLKRVLVALNLVLLAETVDHERAAFIKQYSQRTWPGPSLYHMMINSGIGEDSVVETIWDCIAILEKSLVHA
jgi:hypothetical protein